MKMLTFAKRNFKEIIRDPLNLIFSIGLPLLVLVVMEQFHIPSSVYSIENFLPGIAIFGFSFISLFSGLLIANDRKSSFLTRLYASPLSSFDFIVGYSISVLPITIIQSVLFFIVAFFLGLSVSINVLYTILILIPISVLFIGFGILFGCLFNDKQTPGVTSIFVQVVAWTSGMWFDLNQVGAVFKIISKALPFSYAVDLTRATLNGNFHNMMAPIAWIAIYLIIIYALAVIVFKKKMISDNK